MSKNKNMEFRRQLLATVSTLALLAAACGSGKAKAEDSRPTIWIEFGGQLEGMTRVQDEFVPPFLVSAPPLDFTSINPLEAQRPPKYSQGAQLALSFQPENSGWVFSGLVRYGRSSGGKGAMEQTVATMTPYPPAPQFLITKASHKFIRTIGRENSKHLIADFQAGRDVGLGLLGKDASISLGVRFAQFSERSSFDLHERPDYGWQKKHPFYTRFYHNFAAQEDARRSFHGIGPSLSVKASPSIARPGEDSDITLDWGVNGAVLFGRNQALVHHDTNEGYFHSWVGYTQLYDHPYTRLRKHSAAVPNLGGFVGLSYRYVDAKISLGYRADMFFGAMDGGIDTRKNKNLGFFGPFASISIGMGD